MLGGGLFLQLSDYEFFSVSRLPSKKGLINAIKWNAAKVGTGVFNLGT